MLSREELEVAQVNFRKIRGLESSREKAANTAVSHNVLPQPSAPSPIKKVQIVESTATRPITAAPLKRSTGDGPSASPSLQRYKQ